MTNRFCRLGLLLFTLALASAEGFASQPANANDICPPSQCFTDADCAATCAPFGGTCWRRNPCYRICACLG